MRPCFQCGTIVLAGDLCRPCRDTVAAEAALSIYFWNRVNITGECWEWIGPWHGRYGQANVYDEHGNKQKMLAHRLGFQVQTRKPSSAPVIMHICDNPLCVRLAHLREGTQAENVADMIMKGRAAWQDEDIAILVAGSTSRGPTPWGGSKV
jgi:hypothetical protein